MAKVVLINPWRHNKISCGGGGVKNVVVLDLKAYILLCLKFDKSRRIWMYLRPVFWHFNVLIKRINLISFIFFSVCVVFLVLGRLSLLKRVSKHRCVLFCAAYDLNKSIKKAANMYLYERIFDETYTRGQ